MKSLTPTTQNKTRRATEQEGEVLSYLNDLREEGITNMFGARPYIMVEFDIETNEAKRLLMLWMDNFNSEGDYMNLK